MVDTLNGVHCNGNTVGRCTMLLWGDADCRKIMGILGLKEGKLRTLKGDLIGHHALHAYVNR